MINKDIKELIQRYKKTINNQYLESLEDYWFSNVPIDEEGKWMVITYERI